MSNEPIKRKNKSPIIKSLKWVGVVAISLLLVAYFIFSDISGPDSSVLVGTVDGAPIYYSRGSQYAINYENISQSMSVNMGSLDQSMSDIFSSMIEYQAFVVTANQMLLYNLAKKNINISDEYLVQNIQGSYFVNTNGSLDVEAYNAFIRDASTVDKKRVESDVRESISIQILSHELFQTIKTSSVSIENEFNKVNNRRSIEVVYRDATSQLSAYQPTEAELSMYFNENATNFVQADLSWIVLSSASDANTLYGALKSDLSTFAQTALERSEDSFTATNGGKVGKLTSYEMPSALISEAIFDVKEDNTILEPISFDNAYYIVLVHNISLPQNITDVGEGVVLNEYLEDNNEAILANIKSNLTEQLNQDISDDNISENSNYEYYAVEDFYYGAIAEDIVRGDTVPSSGEKIFSDAVFSTAVGQFSDVIDLPEGVAIINVVAETKSIDPNSEEAANESTQQKLAVAREIYSQRVNRLSSYWSDKAFSKAKIDYKLSK